MRTSGKNLNGGARRGQDAMRIVAELEAIEHALKASEVAALLRVTQQHIYKLAAQQKIPSFRIGEAVRFDPSQIASWLRRKMPQSVGPATEIRIAV